MLFRSLDHHRELLWQSDIVTIAMSGAGGMRIENHKVSNLTLEIVEFIA